MYTHDSTRHQVSGSKTQPCHHWIRTTITKGSTSDCVGRYFRMILSNLHLFQTTILLMVSLAIYFILGRGPDMTLVHPPPPPPHLSQPIFCRVFEPLGRIAILYIYKLPLYGDQYIKINYVGHHWKGLSSRCHMMYHVFTYIKHWSFHNTFY